MRSDHDEVTKSVKLNFRKPQYIEFILNVYGHKSRKNNTQFMAIEYLLPLVKIKGIRSYLKGICLYNFRIYNLSTLTGQNTYGLIGWDRKMIAYVKCMLCSPK